MSESSLDDLSALAEIAQTKRLAPKRRRRSKSAIIITWTLCLLAFAAVDAYLWYYYTHRAPQVIIIQDDTPHAAPAPQPAPVAVTDQPTPAPAANPTPAATPDPAKVTFFGTTVVPGAKN